LARSMKERVLWKGPDPKITASSAGFALTLEMVQAIFDDLYDASWVEVESSRKWGKEPKEVKMKKIMVANREKLEKRFVYDAVQAKGAFLKVFLPDDNGIWVKLWRDMLWNTIRSKPLSRNVYEKRADGHPGTVGGDIWKDLTASAKERLKGRLRTKSYGSSICIGAQDENAEKTPFIGVPEENLLLHFWPVAASIYAPKRLKIDRDPERGLLAKREDAGYVVVVPEPADLKYFVTDSVRHLRSLDVKATGYRPTAALIDVPAEGGMEYLYHLAKGKALAGETGNSLVAIELYHLEKKGKNVRMLTCERIISSPDAIARYETLRSQWANPLFKMAGLRNLLAATPWHQGFAEMFSTQPWQLFVHAAAETPKEIRFFGLDVRRRFKALEEQCKLQKKGGNMGEEGEKKKLDDQLAARAYRLIATYVYRKTEEKSGKRFKDLKDRKSVV